MSTRAIDRSLADTGTVRDPARAAVIWALARISIGLVFVWAFFDKLLALGFATGRGEDGSIDYLGDAAWVSGGSPTSGFLGFATKGPFADMFQSFAGAVWADWLFMAGLLGIGVGLTLGVAMKLAAYSGAAMLMLMWAAVLPPENHPFMDDHIVYAIVLVGLVAVNAGDTLGLGRWWKSTEIVERYPYLA